MINELRKYSFNSYPNDTNANGIDKVKVNKNHSKYIFNHTI